MTSTTTTPRESGSRTITAPPGRGCLARDNPFASHRWTGMRYQFLTGDWEKLLAQLKVQQGRGAIVGSKGTGKTTLLREIAQHLESRGAAAHLLSFRSEAHRLTPRTLATLRSDFRPGDGLLVDGAEQLGRRDWWRLKSLGGMAGYFLITSHRPGLLPTLHQATTSSELLADIVARLLGCDLETARSIAAAPFHEHDGNLRLALRELYDRCASGQLPLARQRS